MSSFSQFDLCPLLLIALTVIISLRGFRNYDFLEKHIFNPEAILAGKEYYRLVSSGFLHADMRHLLMNMFSLLLFARGVIWSVGVPQFLGIYFASIVGGNLLSLYVHRNHIYRALGASGGVCGVIFASILLHPGESISMMYIPLWIPNWLYAIGFMLGSFYGMKQHNRDGIGHDAHLGGAIIGFSVAAGLHPECVRYNPWVFVIVLVLSVALLAYLWVNPLFLPGSAFAEGIPLASFGLKRKRSRQVRKSEEQQLDVILDKVSKTGLESLSDQERAQLNNLSGKYRRRAESSKPQSGLAI